MKKLLVLMLVLGMASAANASLLISVNGETDLPDTEVTLVAPSGEVIIDIWGDGESPLGLYYLGISTGSAGAGSLNIDTAEMLYPGDTTRIVWHTGYGAYMGFNEPYVQIEMADAPPPPAEPALLVGTLVDGIIFHCEGLGDVTLTLADADGATVDTQVIHQIPEPMTIALLGLGGLFLRRRK